MPSFSKSKTNKSKHQRFEVELISREQIIGAPYNPREISKDARKRLKGMMAKHGLVSTLVWNKRTGRLVSGHQRLAILDELEKNTNYSLNVAVIDVDEDEEKKLNVQLNNPSMQGDWNVEALTALMEDGGISPFDMGFNESDVSILFGDDSSFLDLLTDDEDVVASKDTLKKIKEHRAEALEKMKEAQTIQNFFVVVCEGEEQRKAMMKALGVPEYEEYVNGRALAAKLGV